ncbi:hypothetical protein SKAU_G00408660 [Synaphobranchus kaupii]|uniref:Uncharacterized protein n=1 Tax=Synaphobranchus kaupii TaxID=118154 RepID=A0A9Q1EAL6_SYNKA|nr:hypothetical protein SKAU_G00408660 [Synaphobranchus kaupii]
MKGHDDVTSSRDSPSSATDGMVFLSLRQGRLSKALAANFIFHVDTVTGQLFSDYQKRDGRQCERRREHRRLALGSLSSFPRLLGYRRTGSPLSQATTVYQLGAVGRYVNENETAGHPGLGTEFHGNKRQMSLTGQSPVNHHHVAVLRCDWPGSD